MFGLFMKRKSFGDDKKQKFAEAISDMLKIQLAVAKGYSIADGQGNVNVRALGYIYGFIDGALRTIGQDMSDLSIGVPVTFQVLSHLFGSQDASKYIQHLVDNVNSDPVMMSGIMSGGQQYIEFHNKKLSAPMGLARILLDRNDQ
jgi:hypothetical protein